MDEFDFSTSIEALTAEDCKALLATQITGRVAFANGDFPMILPVNFTVFDDFIVFRTDPGTKLDMIPMRPVAFEADGWEQNRAWSVVVQGFAREVTNALGERYARLREAHVALLAPGEKTHWVAIEMKAVSGRAIRLRQPARASSLSSAAPRSAGPT